MASDIAYTIQIDKKEAYEGRRRGSRAAPATGGPRVRSASSSARRQQQPRRRTPASATDLSAHEPVWETGLFTCWDASPFHCFLGVVLPCAIASHVEAMVDRGTFGLGAFFLGIAFLSEIVCATQSIEMGAGGEAWTTRYSVEVLKLNMWGLAACVAAAMFAGGVFAFRNMTRHYYRIPGSCCGDAVIAVFCAPCSMAQVSRHFEKAGPSVYASLGSRPAAPVPAATATAAVPLIPTDTLPAYEELRG